MIDHTFNEDEYLIENAEHWRRLDELDDELEQRRYGRAPAAGYDPAGTQRGRGGAVEDTPAERG